MDNAVHDLLEKAKNESDYFDKAAILQTLKEENKIKIKDMAEYLEMKPSYLCHILRLNKIPDLLRDGYYSKSISITHLFVISRLKDQSQMIDAIEKVLGKNLTTSQTDQLVTSMIYKIEGKGKKVADEVNREMKRKLLELNKDATVNVLQTRVKTKILIELWGNLEVTSQFLKRVGESIKDISSPMNP